MIPIIKKEMQAYFHSMTGYVFLGFLVLISGIYFATINVIQLIPDYSYVLSGTSILFLVLIPILTMRLFSEEAKQKTDQLLFTASLSVNRIVLAKYISAFGFFLIGMLITAIFPALISTFGELPSAKIANAFLGYILLGASFISVGLFISALTDSQIVAAMVTFGAIILLFLLNSLTSVLPVDRASSTIFLCVAAIGISALLYDATRNIYASVMTAAILFALIGMVFFINGLLLEGLLVKAVSWLSLLSRFENFNNGVLNIADIVYYLTFSAAFIYFTIHVIEKRRWR